MTAMFFFKNAYTKLYQGSVTLFDNRSYADIHSTLDTASFRISEIYTDKGEGETWRKVFYIYYTN
jgi:hypothetical protein